MRTTFVPNYAEIGTLSVPKSLISIYPHKILNKEFSKHELMKTLENKGRKKVKKKNVVITLNPELVEKAHELGLNISKVCENALIRAINALEQAYTQNSHEKGDIGTVGSDKWLPAFPASRGRRPH